MKKSNEIQLLASVIVPTYNGAHKFPALLLALLQQTVGEIEVIVVVDGATDNSVEVLRSFAPQFQTLKIVVQQNLGRAAVRNKGVSEATTNLLIFYDDDMAPASDSVARHIAFHQQHAGAILIGNAKQAILDTARDFQHYRAFISDVWMEPYGNSITKLDQHNLFMTAANCSLQKETFLKLRGFDQSLTDAEDRELGLRAFKQNIPLFVDMQNIALHREYITCRAYIQRLRQYALANEKVFGLHPEFVWPLRRNISWTKKLMYRFLATPFWVSAIDDHDIFRILPKKMRYRLYDAITYALFEVYPQTDL